MGNEDSGGVQATLRRALNGCNGEVSLKDIPVYHEWSTGSVPASTLGRQGNSHHVLGIRSHYTTTHHHHCTHTHTQVNKDNWIQANIIDPSKMQEVVSMLTDWTLYEHGWVVHTTEGNEDLMYYLCQIGNYGSHRPPAYAFLVPPPRSQTKSKPREAWGNVDK